ncbi:glutaredoxin [bacterium (Candidatus Blackallbacteria) CG17_big_fil_post_rev_8_21_14_2_50_48_46]|uniref:Glutaredoxin n=1 Tax=bacterium (Candidatus Blackallbacteria) CG17_big_fil_post_rev_8_21_14_2_50_48_46 TaxID=2014261 RepID=A0A2M7G0Q8_9BACT|nr:MAG: glutaredoxin [bacterium (Candidatus Blackallbacteria) CG18_big_fil_WC_8_21_14_2_50_49_26]PIW15298.1 MAG: glutaredoxin [bacterium (Candidatus Blackallbacteria) CG17_big_fil_post_rev_8_21_14_2_50_48_46]PIW45193.1 MAG: glutaredoxin [bacterium (Candidatus Blackallbacteria) CG13_big_fil_rev_8_21_14_2_50_49_14]
MFAKKFFSQAFFKQPAKTEQVLNLKPDELVLYKFDACPFCRRVMAVIEEHQWPVVYRDTRENPQYRQKLIELTGKTQVPCLLVDGQPMLESKEIIQYLQTVFNSYHEKKA